MFTRSKKALAALTVTGAAVLGAGLAAAPAQAAGPGNGAGVSGLVNFYQNGGYSGAVVAFSGSRANFYSMGSVGPQGNVTNWNDQVSGVWNANSHSFWLYQGVNYTGNSMYMMHGYQVDFSYTSWNDTLSSALQA
ncbi:peptidase inhibitor family I36 protein [Streptomyces sp. NPDC093228]|uniref:peptidase inhibitor family I36 protein n=1 Tax=Streptomyces sp. NPDC093228 TaxID=3155070 RepID=UPI003441217D